MAIFMSMKISARKLSDGDKKEDSFEPELNQRPMDVCFCTQLQSTALPTELSKVARHSAAEICSLRK
jgi:hypothetical protein